MRESDREDHALLLCSLLLGFGLDAYVCIGRDHLGAHAWVLTRNGRFRAIFWESLTGQRYSQQDARAMQECPYQTVSCVFHHERFYANIQPDEAISATAFDLENQAHWKAMDEGMISLLKKPSPILFRPNTLNALDEEERLEAELRRQVTLYRDAELGMSTAWDPNLAHLLLPAVSACEDEARLGIPIPSEFQHAIKRAVPLGHTFKGYPQQFNHTCTVRILNQLRSEGVCNDILETRGDKVRFAVRGKIFLYPEEVFAVWVMLAVTFCGVRAT